MRAGSFCLGITLALTAADFARAVEPAATAQGSGAVGVNDRFVFDRPGPRVKETKVGGGVDFRGEVDGATKIQVEVPNDCQTTIVMQTTAAWKGPNSQKSYVVVLEKREVGPAGEEQWKRLGGRELKVGEPQARVSWSVQGRGIYRGVVAARKTISRVGPSLRVDGTVRLIPKRSC